MDGVAGVSAWSCWRSVVACWGACRDNMVAKASPRPPRWRCRCARATMVVGMLAVLRRAVRHERTTTAWWGLVATCGASSCNVGWHSRGARAKMLGGRPGKGCRPKEFGGWP